MDVGRAGIALLITMVVSVLGGTPAAADTLFTSPTRTTLVAIGTTASLTSGTVSSTGTLGGQEVSNDCASSTLTFSIVQNDSAAIVGTVTGGTFSGCAAAVTGNFPWRFTVRGSGVASGSSTVFTTSTWDDVSMTVTGLTSAGDLPDASGSPPTNGVYARQTTATGTGICLEWSDAPVPGPFLTDGTMSATYCLEGAPATSWSIGLPPASFLRVDPSGATVATGATVSNGGGTSQIFLGIGNVVCEGAWGVTAGASGGAVVSGAVDRATLTSCTDTVPGIAVTSCARFAAGTSPVSFRATNASGGSVEATGLYLRCALAATTTGCYYNAPSLSGTVTSANASLGGTVTHEVPTGVTDDTGAACGASGLLVSALSHLTTGTATTVTLRTS